MALSARDGKETVDQMKSLRELYRMGRGPSSSHTMGPDRAAQRFLERPAVAKAVRFEVELRGSLSATGRGHFTDGAVLHVLGANRTSIVWDNEPLPAHPNGLIFRAFDTANKLIDVWQVYSVGGGAISETGAAEATPDVYPYANMEEILSLCEKDGVPLWNVVERCEGPEIWMFLGEVWRVMCETLERGLAASGVLAGGLRLPRKARQIFLKARKMNADIRRTGLVAAYAYAVNEENAAMGTIVTAPTCGSCGTLPAVLKYLHETSKKPEIEILRALAVAGLFGNVAKQNATISGAEAGCQAEVGVACAMAAAAAAYLFDGTSRQVETAAEVGLEHFLGLTCDPILGLVQIPCIERNAVAANRALVAAELAILSDGQHFISYDNVVRTMLETGHDLPSLYRETSLGGLSRLALNI